MEVYKLVLGFKFGYEKLPCYCCNLPTGRYKCLHVEPILLVSCNDPKCDLCIRRGSIQPTQHWVSLFIDGTRCAQWRMGKHDIPSMWAEGELDSWKYVELSMMRSGSLKEAYAFLDYFGNAKRASDVTTQVTFNRWYMWNFIPPFSWCCYKGAKKDDIDFKNQTKWFCSELVTAMLIERDYAPEVFGVLQPYKTTPQMLYDACDSIKDSCKPVKNLLPDTTFKQLQIEMVALGNKATH
jgi:hypothetical protein